MKSLHDYRGEYAAACRRYGRALNRWWRGERNERVRDALADAMFAARNRYHAQLNTPKRKRPSKRARRRARYMFENIARLIEENRTKGPRLVRIYARDASELPAVREARPADNNSVTFHAPPMDAVPITIVPYLEGGYGFVEYSDGSLQKVRLGSGATT